VLYVHGLESGPVGGKAGRLAEAGFDLRAEAMPCGQAAVRRAPFVVASAAGALGLGGLGALLGPPGWLAAGLAWRRGYPRWRRHLTRRVFARSVAVQEAALARHRPEVVVGSSFGGAVTLALMRSGAWRGPTVLLCPAWKLVVERAGWPEPPPLAQLPGLGRVLVVHGTADDVVPLAHSQALVAGSAASLTVVEDDHRLSATATTEGLAAWVRQVAEP
jgi:fermentation-respiration switch protein FrsA (DUF1100 family)